MTRFSLRLPAFGLVLLLAALCHAGDDQPTPGELIPASTLRADFISLYRRLREAHIDLYVHRSQGDYDRFHAQMLGALTQPMTDFDARIHFQKFVAYGNVAHANIPFPGEVFETFKDQGGRTLPVYLRIVNGRAFVGENYSGNEKLQVGDEIITLNDLPIARWLERAAAHISADTPYIAHSLLEFSFPRYVWVEIGEVDTFTLQIADRQGENQTVAIKALGREQQRVNASEQPHTFSLDANARVARMLEDSVAYLRPGPFYNVEDPGNLWNTDAYIDFINTSFQTFIKEDARHLIIDLRQNPGGDNSFSDPMLAWIAKEPFRFCSAFLIRSSDEAAASNQSRLDENPGAVAGVSGLFAERYANVPRGETFEFDIPLVPPRGEPRFDGQVYVLVNRHSYSNSVNVAAIVQDYNLGIVAGEKTADMATTYGAMETFTLAGTGIEVGFPKAHIIRPSGDTRADGVTPDWPIETPIVGSHRDVVLDRLVEKIKTRLETKR